MNLNKIKDIVNSIEIPDTYKEILITQILSEDKNLIPTLLRILEEERKSDKKIKSELNVLLSKASVGLENKKLNKNNFIGEEIKKFYIDNNDRIQNVFKEYEKE